MTTNWLSPPTAIRGLDHLGIQSTCVALYTELLPGITNVTDRAYYFGFHPWFVWAFEQHFVDRSEDSYTRAVRAAECLVTLTAIRHRHRSTVDSDIHDVGTIGNRKLGAAYASRVPGGTIDLGPYAALEGESASYYFKARWGGLGQYYLGSLFDLRLMGYKEKQKPAQPHYGIGLGETVARSFDHHVPRELFFDVLARGRVTDAELDSLAEFCPCQLRTHHDHRELLASIFFGRRKDALDDGREDRRDSLRLFLEIIRVAETEKIESSLRCAAYSACLPAGSAWKLPERLERVRRKWGVYQLNELMSLAVQGLFWAALLGIEQQKGRLRDVAQAGDVIVTLARKTPWSDHLGTPLRLVVDDARKTLPPLGEWTDPAHENARALDLADTAGGFRASAEEITRSVGHSIAILVALLARREASTAFPYAEFALGVDRFGSTELDLVTFARESSHWLDLTVEAWLRTLAEDWGVRRHLQVALRKMRTDGRDTFRLRPLDDGLRLVEAAPAGFTGPRVNKAQQILIDLGLVDRTELRTLTLTDLGKRELEVGHG